VKARLLQMTDELVRGFVVVIEQDPDLQGARLTFVAVGEGVYGEHRVTSAAPHHGAHRRMIGDVEAIDSALSLRFEQPLVQVHHPSIGVLPEQRLGVGRPVWIDQEP